MNPDSHERDVAAVPVERPPELPPSVIDAAAGDKKSWGEEYKPDLKWAFSLLLLTILGLSGGYNQAWQRSPVGRENLSSIVTAILSADQLVFLLQLVGILLVAALVASVVLAIREPDDVDDLDTEAH